jgi:hypothetical protein
MVTNDPETPWVVEIVVDSSFCDQPGSASSYGYFTLMDGRPVAWRCKKNPSVCTSTCEAEYNGYCEGSKECTFMKQLLEECKFKFQQITLRGDSVSAKALAKSWSVSQRTKHIEMRCHYVRHNHIDKKTHGIEFVGTKENISDMFTKALSNQPLYLFREKTMMKCPE